MKKSLRVLMVFVLLINVNTFANSGFKPVKLLEQKKVDKSVEVRVEKIENIEKNEDIENVESIEDIENIESIEDIENEIGVNKDKNINQNLKNKNNEKEKNIDSEKLNVTKVENEKNIDNVKNEAKGESNGRIIDISLKRKSDNGIVYADKEGIPYTGKFAIFLGDKIEYSETYVNGILQGKKSWYSDEGKIILQENYVNGKIEGEQKAFYENGGIKSIVIYKNGKIMGITAFSKDGKILHKADLSKGNGKWRYFWENGQVLEEGQYKNWRKDGVWKRYRKNGEVDITSTYKNGRLISKIWG